MAKQPATKGGLEVDEDRAWQERFWTIQRIGWAVMALILLAALLGATGKGGPLASASARSPAGTIDYPRITRWQSSDQVAVRLPASASGKVNVELSPEFAETFTIESVEPEPSQVQATAHGDLFTFDVGNGGGEKEIVFNVRAQKPLLYRSVEARIGDGPRQPLALTVLP